MTTFRKVGLTLIIIGIGMFILGAYLFSYQGPPLNPIISSMGMYSFFLWLPTIIVGTALTAVGGNKKK